MRELVYSRAAQRDLVSTLEYVARASGSIEAGRRFVEQLRQQCAKLAAISGTLGRPRPELRPDMRSFPFKGYIIFFRYMEDSLEVVSILEGHRDVEAYFRKRRRE